MCENGLFFELHIKDRLCIELNSPTVSILNEILITTRFVNHIR